MIGHVLNELHRTPKHLYPNIGMGVVQLGQRATQVLLPD